MLVTNSWNFQTLLYFFHLFLFAVSIKLYIAYHFYDKTDKKNVNILTTLQFYLLLFRVFGFYYLVRNYVEQFLSYCRHFYLNIYLIFSHFSYTLHIVLYFVWYFKSHFIFYQNKNRKIHSLLKFISKGSLNKARICSSMLNSNMVRIKCFREVNN